MQRRAQQRLEQSNRMAAANPTEFAAHPHSPPESASTVPPSTQNLQQPFQGILERLGVDGETGLLLILILILVNDGADQTLILALVYILVS